MSIKTSKRIALGVIASLVFAPFAAIAPASAADGDQSATVSVDASPYTATVGRNISIPVKLLTDTAGAATSPALNNAVTLVATSVTKPVAAAAPTVAAAIAATATTPTVINHGKFYLRAATNLSGTTTGNWTIATSTNDLTVTAAAANGGTAAKDLAGVSVGTFNFTPITSGTYTFDVTPTSSAKGAAGVDTKVTITIQAVAPTASAIVQRSTARIDRSDNAVITAVGLYDALLRFESGPSTQTAAGLTTGAIFNSSSTGVITGQAISGGTNFTFNTATANLKEGAYVFRAFDDIDLSGSYNAGDSTGTLLTINVAKDAQGTGAITLQRSIANQGTTMTASFAALDSEGKASYWVSSESVTVEAFLSGSTTASNKVTASYSHTLGYAIVTIAGDAPVGEYTVKAKGPGGDYATTGSSAKFTVVSNAGYAASITATKTANLVFDATNNGVGNAASTATITADKAATSITFTFLGGNYAAGGAVNVPVTVTPAVGTSAGAIVGPGRAVINPDGTGTFTVTNASPTDGDSYEVKIPTNSAQNQFVGFTVTYTFAAPTFRAINQSPAAAFTVKTESTNTVSAILDNGYGVAEASKSVTVTVSGRNPATSVVTTDAAGKVSLTWTDAPAVASATTDTITFTHAYIDADGDAASTTAEFVVTYTATGIVVTNVLVTASAATAVIDTVEQFAGQPAGTAQITYTATVSDANGLPLASGNVVTFAGGADDLFINGVKTATTNAQGQATVTVYRQKAGYANITASIAGISGTNNSTLWATTAYTGNGGAAAGNVFRNITVVNSGNTVPEGVVRFTATVTDRWGNGVSAVPVTIAILGPGRLLSPDTATMNTNTNGVVQFNITSNKNETGTLTATLSVVGGQTLDLAGYVSTPTNPVVSRVVAGVTAGNDKATSTATFATPVVVTPEVVVPPVAPTLTGELAGRVLLFGACQVDEGDMIIYVKSPGKAWQERAKTLECVAGEFDGSIKAPKNTKLYRVKQEGTGLWSSSVLIRP